MTQVQPFEYSLQFRPMQSVILNVVLGPLLEKTDVARKAIQYVQIEIQADYIPDLRSSRMPSPPLYINEFSTQR